MVRKLEVISGSDQSPTIDYTDDMEWTRSEFESQAQNGQSGVSRFILFDEEGLIPDGIAPGKFLNSHNVVRVTDGPYTLFRGRIGARDAGRGTRRGRRTRTWEVTVHDYNADLHGIYVDSWVRPAETDVARVNALAAAYLAGSPRVTTNLATTYVSSSNTSALAAKTYTGVTPNDILSELAETAGKIFFVTVDGQIFYDGQESTAYASSLRISDDPADANATTYAPIWDAGSPVTEHGGEQLTALRLYYGTSNESVQVTNTLAPITDYWEGVKWDDRAASTAEASVRAATFLEELGQDTITFTCSIGPIPWAQLGSIKAGQTIQFKARAAKGGRNSDGSRPGDSFQTIRIRGLRWRFEAPETNFALLTLEKLKRVRGKDTLVEKALVTAQRAVTQPPATLTAGANNLTTIYERIDEDGTIDTTWGSVSNFVARSGTDFNTNASGACRASPPDGMWLGEELYFAAIQTNSALPSEPASAIGLQLVVTLRGNEHSAGKHGGINGTTSPIKGPHLVSAKFNESAPSNNGLETSAQVGVVYQNTGDKTVTLNIPSVGWGQHCTIYFQPLFRLLKASQCESGYTGGADPGAGDGSFKIGDQTLKPLTVTGPGWVTAGVIGTRNGVNAAFTLAGGYSSISEVWHNGLSLPLSSISLDGTPNISTVGWAPISTDTVLIRYYVP